MFIKGHVEQWTTIVNLGNLGMTSIPRKQIMAFADVCQANLMYYLSVSYYVNMSWGQRTLLKAISGFINPETLAKMKFTGDGVHPEIAQMFHPNQLERRFGGAMDTPTNFWPPYVGKEFIPPNTEHPMPAMNDDEYR